MEQQQIAQVFVSAKKGPSFFLPGKNGYQRKMEGTGIPEARFGAKIKFRAIAGDGFNAKGLASKDGRARGILHIKRAVADCHQRGWTDVTEEEVYRFLRQHRGYGRDFVDITESADQEINDYIIPEPAMGEHALYCTLCDQHLGHQGRVHGHESSQKHKKLAREADMDRQLKAAKAVVVTGGALQDDN